MPRLIAHRGFAGRYPENTLTAFRAAAADAAMVELDVRRCLTGEAVVIHDARLDRVTDRTGRVDATPYEALADADVLGTGEGVPLLSDVFEILPSEVGVNVELKTPRATEAALDVAAAYDHEVIVSSFDPNALRQARTQADFPTGLLYSEEVTSPVEWATELDCSYLHPPKTVTNRSLVRRARDAGLRVNVWTVENAAEAALLRTAGPDGLITDVPDVGGEATGCSP